MTSYIRLGISIILAFTSTWAMKVSADDQTIPAQSTECADDIFLPAEVFQYTGPGARSVWLGATKLPEDMKAYIASLTGKLKPILDRVSKETEKLIAESVVTLEPSHQLEIKKASWRPSFEKPERLHATLKYLGKISPDSCAEKTIIKALNNVLVFPMKLVPSEFKILTTPNGTPRLLLLTFYTPNLNLFKMSIENALDGFKGRDTREFLPHVTIYTFRSIPKGAVLDEEKVKAMVAKLKQDLDSVTIAAPPYKILGFEFVQTATPHIVLKAFGEQGIVPKTETPMVPEEVKPIEEIPTVVDVPKDEQGIPEAPAIEGPKDEGQGVPAEVPAVEGPKDEGQGVPDTVKPVEEMPAVGDVPKVETNCSTHCKMQKLKQKLKMKLLKAIERFKGEQQPS